MLIKCTTYGAWDVAEEAATFRKKFFKNSNSPHMYSENPQDSMTKEAFFFKLHFEDAEIFLNIILCWFQVYGRCC